MKKLLRRALLALFVLALLFVGGSWHLANHLTGPRPHLVGASPSDFTYPIESITFISRDQETLSG